MPSNPAFDLFEEICGELSGKQETILVDDDFSTVTMADLKKWSHETAAIAAISKAMDYLGKHFEARGAILPFNYDLATGLATSVNHEYINFVADAQDQRSLSKESRDFEVATSHRLSNRLTGILRRVGTPRTKHKTRAEFAAYLVKEFGFEPDVLVGQDRDGGFDILWFPPLGAFPFRATVSIQCKNSLYDRDDGLKSVGRAKQCLSRHTHASADEGHLHCVLYNDYIDEGIMAHARDVGFVPLGLSDLAPLVAPILEEHL